MAARFDVLDGIEDEMMYLEHANHCGNNRIGVIVERGDPFEDLGDRKFEERFRLSKETVWWLVDQMNDRLEFPTNRNNPVSPMNRVLATLRSYATGAFNIVIGDTANIHRTTVQRITSEVSEIIASFFPRFIVFPARADLQNVMDGFHQIDGFPGVIGTIDCTHIRIQSPGGDNAEHFRNRKGYFSLNCQTISDHNLLIRDIVARWAGSVHDSTIFRNCARRAPFENGEIPHGYLLGDGGYACKPYLLTPLLNPLTPAEQRYNRAHIKTRNTVERQYGIWKRRFPILSVGLRCGLQKAMTVITATAVLHNIARSTSNEEPPEDPQMVRLLEELRGLRGPDIDDDEPVPQGELMQRNDAVPGRAFRQAIINQHFQ
ncbi:putative nuclease HARBI1 isoform X1 [Periplaneta americana]|uniref:putative nuclease HARBI1 isoform X1 n=1 Tax=Periplaneta americana TaxID=6978 RepID=UPI0037E879F9